ncbi:type IV secretion system protein DotA [Rickettsiella grylli]|nr:type IV secretion system protein DotA [Rickettsiella grylli]
MKKFLLAGFFCLFPSLVLSDTLSLAPASADLSMTYLATIFGVVDGVLHGTGSQILGSMFGAFNSIILVMASTVLSYVLFVSILNTSHEGEFLGRKWSSIWVPLRTVGGIGLLLPKATGYSFIQVLVMWVVVQGVGAADEVWDVALNYMNRNGTIVEPIQSLAPDHNLGEGDNTFLINRAGTILKSEACMLSVQNALTREIAQNAGTTVYVPNFMSSLSVTGKSPGGANTGLPIDYSKDIGGFITFPGKKGLVNTPYAKYIGICGNASWNFIGKDDHNQVDNPAQLTANDSASIAVRQMTLDLGGLAKSIANKLVPPNSTTPVLPIQLTVDPNLFNPNGLVDAGDDYFAIVKPALRSLNDDASQQYKKFITKAKEAGWILAGSYYYNMARLEQSIKENTGLLVIKDKLNTSFFPNYDKGSFNDISNENVKINLKNNLPMNNGVIDRYVDAEMALAGSNNNPGPEANPTFPKNKGEIPAVGTLVNGLMNIIFPQVYDFEKTLSDNINKQHKDPIFALVSVGNGLVSMVEKVWIGILGAAVALGGISGVVSFFFPGPAIVAGLVASVIISVFMPLITIWMIINLILGSLLSYYVPLIPFFLFTFGAITWFAVVLEAVLAAPLVALGITHPEGHDFLGKAEQSIMLLASVFLRPMLMVFGLIFGIILSYVALSVFNRGFAIAVQFLTEYNGDLLSIIYQLAMMAIYTAAILAIVNRSFAMIYEVPNKVLRWIGGPQESGHEESMLQSIRGQHDRDIGHIAQQAPTAQTFNDAITTGQQASKAMLPGNQTSATTEGGDEGGTPPPGGGGGASGGGGSSSAARTAAETAAL